MISFSSLDSLLDFKYKGKFKGVVIYQFQFHARNRLARGIESIMKINVSIKQEGIIELNTSSLKNNEVRDLLSILNRQNCKYKIY